MKLDDIKPFTLKISDGKDECEVEFAVVKHGKWADIPHSIRHECSECKNFAPSYYCGDENLTDYCPNCGAKMERSEE